MKKGQKAVSSALVPGAGAPVLNESLLVGLFNDGLAGVDELFPSPGVFRNLNTRLGENVLVVEQQNRSARESDGVVVSILVLRAVFPLEEVVLLLLGQLIVQLEQQTVGNEVICVGHIDHVRSVVVEQSGVNRRVIVAPRQNFHIHFAVVLRLKSIEPAIPETASETASPALLN